MAGAKENGSGNIMEALLAMLLFDRFAALANNGQSNRSEEAEQLRSDIRKSLKAKTTDADKKE